MPVKRTTGERRSQPVRATCTRRYCSACPRRFTPSLDDRFYILDDDSYYANKKVISLSDITGSGWTVYGGYGTGRGEFLFFPEAEEQPQVQ